MGPNFFFFQKASGFWPFFGFGSLGFETPKLVSETPGRTGISRVKACIGRKIMGTGPGHFSSWKKNYFRSRVSKTRHFETRGENTFRVEKNAQGQLRILL